MIYPEYEYLLYGGDILMGIDNLYLEYEYLLMKNKDDDK